MPTPSESMDKKTGGAFQRKEQEIMIRLTELLLEENLISPEEKNKLSVVIQKGGGPNA